LVDDDDGPRTENADAIWLTLNVLIVFAALALHSAGTARAKAQPMIAGWLSQSSEITGRHKEASRRQHDPRRDHPHAFSFSLSTNFDFENLRFVDESVCLIDD
jgi:hypothetical protein